MDVYLVLWESKLRLTSHVMALENIKKAITALEREMFSYPEVDKRIEWAKVYLTCFYYKSAEEYHLGKYPDSRVSLRIYAALCERMLGKSDPFSRKAFLQVAEKDEEVSYAFHHHKRHKVNYSKEEINSLNKTTYKAFEFSEDRLSWLASLIPVEHRYNEAIELEEESVDNADEQSPSPVNRNRMKNQIATFQSFM